MNAPNEGPPQDSPRAGQENGAGGRAPPGEARAQPGQPVAESESDRANEARAAGLVKPPFVKAIRGNVGLELVKANNHAFALLYVVAQRARRYAGFNSDNLRPGEALVGDYRAIGMSRQEYRTALNFLVTRGFLTTKPTSQGTVARLVNTDIFDINVDDANQPTNQPPTNTQPSPNHRLTTNKEGKKERMGESLEALALSQKGVEGGKTLSPPTWEEWWAKIQEFSFKVRKSTARKWWLGLESKDWKAVVKWRAEAEKLVLYAARDAGEAGTMLPQAPKEAPPPPNPRPGSGP